MVDRAWTIPVCRYCDKLAEWPFTCCEEGPAARSRGERWYTNVTVHSHTQAHR